VGVECQLTIVMNHFVDFLCVLFAICNFLEKMRYSRKDLQRSCLYSTTRIHKVFFFPNFIYFCITWWILISLNKQYEHQRSKYNKYWIYDFTSTYFTIL